MTPVLYWYPGCASCKAAAKALDARGVAHVRVDLGAAPPDAATLSALIARSGLAARRFFNTSGRSYRDGGFGARAAAMPEAEIVAALAADGMLVKRPLLDTGTQVLVGAAAISAFGA